MRATGFLTLLFSLPVHAVEFQRELSADRPDTTESPYTVEPGGIQVESNILGFSRDRSDGMKTETWALAETNVKFGMTESIDLQWVFRPWISEHESGSGQTQRSEGFGDIDLRLKWNLWGNDGGNTAAAIMPYATTPTRTSVSSDEWQGGIIFPVSIDLTETLGLGFQGEAARVWDDDNDEYEWDFLHSIVLGAALSDKTGAFVEYVGVTGDGAYEASGFVGFTWSPSPNIQWDISGGIGFNDAAEDFSAAQGVTFRF
jgi:hypothetical protein